MNDTTTVPKRRKRGRPKKKKLTDEEKKELEKAKQKTQQTPERVLPFALRPFYFSGR